MVQRYSSPMAQALGDTLNNIGGIMLNQPTQVELDKMALENDYYRARSEQARAGAAVDQAKIAAPSKLAQAISSMYQTSEGARPSPNFVGPGAPKTTMDFSRAADLTPLAVAAGVDPRQVLDSVTRSSLLADPSSPLASSMLNILGDDYAKTIGGFQQSDATARREDDLVHKASIYGHDADLTGTRYTADRNYQGKIYDVDTTDRRARDMPTLEQARGMEFSNIANAGGFVDPSEVPPAGSVASRLLGGSNATQQTAKNWVTADGRQMGQTLDGVTDTKTGQPLPDTALVANEKDLDPSGGIGFRVNPDGSTEFTTNTNSSGWQKQTMADLESATLALDDYKNLSGQVKNMAAQLPDAAFGTAGNLIRTSQGVVGQIDALTNILGTPEMQQEYAEAAAGIQQAAASDPQFGQLVQMLDDPNFQSLQGMSVILAYKGAAAIGDQSGKGLSNEDFNRIYQALGDPTSWLATKKSYLSKLAEIDKYVDTRVQQVNTARGITTPASAQAAPAPAQQLPVPPTVPQPLADRAPNLDFSPSRQQYRDRTTGETFDLNGNPVQ